MSLSIQDRLRAHMGKAEIPDVLPDCREAADTIDALVKGLETLLGEAISFSVSGVYFDEDCMGHKGPALARAALDLVGGTITPSAPDASAPVQRPRE